MATAAWAFVNGCARTLLKQAVQCLHDHCDPDPLLRETEDQLTYSKSKTYNQILLIDKCVALRYMGQFDRVLETLINLNIDQYSGTLPQNKVIYYNNMADAYLEVKDTEKAMIWQSKARQIAVDMKNPKIREALLDTLSLNDAAILVLRGQYAEAEQALLTQAGKQKPLVKMISTAMLFAEIGIHIGNCDAAREHLNFVIANGNKVFDVQRARNMLDNLQNSRADNIL
jgi:tetratricopeptide (TPR) repeat protein